MPPRGAEPFDVTAVTPIGCDAPERVDHVARAHLLESEEQAAGVVQHDAGRMTPIDEARHELADAFVAPPKNRSVVVVADVLMLHHVLKMADHGGGSEIVTPFRHQRLVHVEGDGEAAVDGGKIDVALGRENGILSFAGGRRFILPAADFRQFLQVFSPRPRDVIQMSRRIPCRPLALDVWLVTRQKWQLYRPRPSWPLWSVTLSLRVTMLELST